MIYEVSFEKVRRLPLLVLVLWRLEPGEVMRQSSIVIVHGHTISCNNIDNNNDKISYYNCVKILHIKLSKPLCFSFFGQ